MSSSFSNTISRVVERHHGGIKVPDIDHTHGNKPTKFPIPNKVRIPMSMHMGAPCKPLVKRGDEVQVGQIIADSEALFSAPIHASISGKVTGISVGELDAAGNKISLIEIESDGKMTPWSEIKIPNINSHQDFIQSVRDSGVVGLGGAGFPTSVKFATDQKIEILIANGAECEPYNTSDYYTMQYRTKEMLNGLKESMKWLNIDQGIIFVEENKMSAVEEIIKLLETKSDQYPNIKVMVAPVLYPRGAEKVVIQMTTGRVVPAGKLPADVNVLVSNVTTLAEIGKFLETGVPLIDKVVTVDGQAIREPQNVLVPIGTEIYEILKFCDLDESIVESVIMGGPMMGVAVGDINSPLIKMNNAILAMTKAERGDCPATECIRCAKCVRGCPMKLSPTIMYKAIMKENLDQAKEIGVMNCIECGACSYSCPADIALVHWFRQAKSAIRTKER